MSKPEVIQADLVRAITSGWLTNHPERLRPLFGLKEHIVLILPTRMEKLVPESRLQDKLITVL